MSFPSPSASPLLKVDVRMPRLRGEDGTIAIPRERHVSRRLVPDGPSVSRVKRLYSVWTAVTGAILMARRKCGGRYDTLQSPICLILPSLCVIVGRYVCF